MKENNKIYSKIREKAKKILSEKKEINKTKYSSDLEGLIEELHIYQIELEQQNTELNRAQISLKKSEQHYQKLFDNSPTAIFIVNNNSVVEKLNKTACFQLSKTKSQIINKHFTELVHPDFQDDYYFYFIKLKNGKNTEPLDIKLIGNRGVIIYCRLYSTKYDDDKFIFNLTDITKKKKFEEDLTEVNRRLDLALKAADIGVWDMDLVNDNLVWDDGMYKLYEIEKQDFNGNQNWWLNKLHPEDVNSAEETFINATKELKQFNAEFRILTPKGKIKHIKAIAEIISNENNNAVRAVGVNMDITETKELIKNLNIARKKAEEDSKLKSAFLANMSHEIRTPMNGIVGFADLLKNPKLKKEQKSKFINVIEKSSERMLNIINDLIDISKIEANQVTLNLSKVNIYELINSTYEFFKPQIDAKNIKLKYYIDPKIKSKSINTDLTKVTQILHNLLSNAIKFTTEGEINFGCTSTKNTIKIYVKDTGKGISIKDQKFIFNRFRKIEDREFKFKEGVGLGLSISKAYAKLLGGDLFVKSKKDEGSEFWFVLNNN